MAIVEVHHLHKEYDGRPAVEDVSFGVERGEIFGILGPNGAGKTTTVECVSGLRRPDGGRVRVLGHDPVRDRRAVTEAVGVQLQHSELQPTLRVGEALDLFSSFYPHPADWRELVDLLGLSNQVHTAFAKLSGGQQQRLSILGVPLLAGALVWTLAASTRLGPDTPARRRLVVTAVHLVLAGLLVWLDTWYGVFAYAGSLFVFRLPPRWMRLGFGLVAVELAAAMSGGYPDGTAEQTVVFCAVAGITLTLSLSSSGVIIRMLDQSEERGRMIDQLAEANGRLEATMAENAGLHAQLLTQAREAGVREERQRLAGEIHDTLAQGLTGIIAQLEAAEQARQRPEERSRHLGLARSLARSSLTEARRSVRALRPEQLEQASLAEALDRLVTDWSERSGVPARLETTGTPARAGADTEAAVFRTAQEALANVAKHAGATKVQLTLTYLDDTLLLDVQDGGRGFDPDAPVGGYGLVGMRARLATVGSVLTVESAPGEGTTLNASFPLGGA